jgi:hypothetical protein
MSTEIDLAADMGEDITELTLTEHFGLFRKYDLPKQQNDVEIVRARQAYYAGAAAMLALVTELEIGDKSLQERGAVYERLLCEIEEYVETHENADRERIRLALEGIRRGQH